MDFRDDKDLDIEAGESTEQSTVCAESLESLELPICATTENTAADVMATMNGPECDASVEPEMVWLAIGGLPDDARARHGLQDK